MFKQNGLSLEQAPPISVVLNFFITASIFGSLLAVFLVLDSLELISFVTQTKELIIVHTLALGVMASFMLGALFQMLPVIAGVVIQLPTKKATVVHLLLVVGVLVQVIAFAKGNSSLLYFLAGAYLGSGLLYALGSMLKELLKIKNHSSSSKGMIFALLSFTLAILLGLYLLLSLGGYVNGLHFVEAKEAHYSFALFGWVSLLIVSVSFQVIEMFYVTPKYPPLMSNYLTATIFLLLLLKTILLFMGITTQLINIMLPILFILYAISTLERLNNRKRPTSDATVWFWSLGMALLILSMTISFLGNTLGVDKILTQISYLSFIGFALSIVFAMVYKIVPFLVWFHLSNQGYMEAPMMHDVIHPKKAKMHFKIHLGTIVALFIGFNTLASLLLTLSFGWLLYQLIFALKKYHYVQKHTEKIEW
jgi:hypothetical protein